MIVNAPDTFDYMSALGGATPPRPNAKIDKGRPTAVSPLVQDAVRPKSGATGRPTAPSAGRPVGPFAQPPAVTPPAPSGPSGPIDIGKVDLNNPMGNKYIAACVEDTKTSIAVEGILGAVGAQLAMDVKVAAYKVAKLRAWAILRNAYLVAASETATDLKAWTVACNDAASAIDQIKTTDAKALAEKIRKIPQWIADAHWNDSLINKVAFDSHWTLNTITGGVHFYATIPVPTRDPKTRAILTSAPTVNTDADQWFLYPTMVLAPVVGTLGSANFKDSQGSSSPPFFLPSSAARPEDMLHLGWFFTNWLAAEYQSSSQLQKVAPVLIGKIQKWLDANGVQGRVPATGWSYKGMREKSKNWKSMGDQPIYAGDPVYQSQNTPLRKVSWYEEDIFPFMFGNVGWWRQGIQDVSKNLVTSETVSAGKVGDKLRETAQKLRAETPLKDWKAAADKARESIAMTLSYLANYGQAAGGVGSFDLGEWSYGDDGLWRLQPKGLYAENLDKVFNGLKIQQGLALPFASSADAAAALPTFDKWLWTKSVKLSTNAEKTWGAIYDFQPQIVIEDAIFNEVLDKRMLTLKAAHILSLLEAVSPSGLLFDRAKLLTDTLDKAAALPPASPCALLPEPWATWASYRGEVEGQAQLTFVLGQFAADRAKFVKEYMEELNALTQELYGCTIPDPPADLEQGKWAAWFTEKLLACQAKPSEDSLLGALNKLNAAVSTAKDDCANGSAEACELVKDIEKDLATAQAKVASRLGALGATHSGIKQRRGGGEGDKGGSIYDTADKAQKKLEELKKKASATITVTPEPTPPTPDNPNPPPPKPVEVAVGISEDGASNANAGAAAAAGAVTDANAAGAAVVGVGEANQQTMTDTGVGQGAGGEDMTSKTNEEVKVDLPPEPEKKSNLGLLAIAALGALALLRK